MNPLFLLLRTRWRFWPPYAISSLCLVLVLSGLCLLYRFVDFGGNGNEEPVSPALLASWCDCCSPEANKDTEKTHSDGSEHGKEEEEIDRSSIDNTLADFSGWMAETLSHSAPIPPESLARGLELAKERRPIISGLIQEAPEEALLHALKWDEYLALPPEIQAYVEEPFSVLAEWLVIPVCEPMPLGPEENIVQMLLRYEDGPLESWGVLPFGRRIEMTSKEALPLQGIHLEGHAAVSESVFQALSTAEWRALSDRFPIANRNRGLSALDNARLPPNPLAAIAGGKVFLFKDEEERQRAEKNWRAIESLIGPAHVFPSQPTSPGGPTLDPEAAFAVTQAASAAWTLSPKTVLCIIVDFPDYPGAPIEMIDLLTQMSGPVDAAIRRFSYGKTHIVPVAAPQALYRMPRSVAEYEATSSPDNEIYADAVAAAVASGATLNDYAIRMVYFGGIGRPYAGMASLGGSRMWLQHSASDRTIVHELGHNYGVGHAGFWECPADSACADGIHHEYGDPFDVMGGGHPPEAHFNPYFKSLLNWIDEDRLIEVSASTGTFRLYAFDHSEARNDATLALRLQFGESETFYVGLRQSFIANPSLSEGLYVVWNHSNRWSRLLDMTPGSRESWGQDRMDAALPIYQTFTDPTRTISITPVARGGVGADAWMDVYVVVGPRENTPPTVTLAGPGTGLARRSVHFAAQSSDADGDPLFHRWNFGDSSRPGSIAESTRFPGGGNFDVTVTVSDGRGGTASDSHNVDIQDPLDAWSVSEAPTGFWGYPRIIRAGGLWFAGGSGSRAAVSPDGLNWRSVDFPLSGDVEGIAYTPGRFVVAFSVYDSSTQSRRGYLLESADAQNWMRIDLGTLPRLRGVAFGNGRFVATAESGMVLTSEKEGDWLIHTPDLGGASLHRIISTADGFFAAADGANGLFHSPAGTAWELIEPHQGIPSGRAFLDLAQASESGVIVAITDNQVFTSADGGLTWSGASLPRSYSMWGLSMTSGPDFFTLVARHYNFSEGRWESEFLLSLDGENWHQTPLDTSNTHALAFGNNRLLRISMGDPVTIALSGPHNGEELAPTITLDVPININARESFIVVADATANDPAAVELVWDFGDGGPLKPGGSIMTHTYAVGGDYAIRVYASDGRGGTAVTRADRSVIDGFWDWSSVVSSEGLEIHALASNGHRIVGVGHRFIHWSDDGLEWNAVNVGTNHNIYDIVWTGAEFFAVGMDYDFASSAWVGVVLHSAEGKTWNQLVRGGPLLRAITFGAGKIVARGDAGYVLSADSREGPWIPANSGLPGHSGGLAFASQTGFVTATFSGLRVSENGVHWNPFPEAQNSPSWASSLVSFRGRVFAAMHSNIFSTSDGKTWRFSPVSEGGWVQRLSASDWMITARGRLPSDGELRHMFWISLDGETWTTIDAPDEVYSFILHQNRLFSPLTGGRIARSGLIAPPVGWSFWVDAHLSDGQPPTQANFLQYALGMTSTSGKTPSVSVSIGDEAAFVVQPRGHRRADVLYDFLWSTNLHDWTMDGLTVTRDDEASLEAELHPRPEGPVFFRLRVQQ